MQNDDKELISVIVPTYNVEKYLERCINSLVCQTYKNLEIIIVDDGSTDHSGEIADRLARSDARISVIHKSNGGLSSARNAGLENAMGNYIGFIDSDDVAHIDMYKILYSSIKDNMADIAQCGYTEERDGSKVELFCKNKKETIIENENIIKAYITEPKKIGSSFCTKLFRRDVIEKERFKYGIQSEDVELIYKVLMKVNRVVCVPLPLYRYIHRDNSITAVIKNSIFDVIDTSAEIYSVVSKKYPHLKKEAKAFQVRMVVDIYDAVKRNGKYNEYKDKMKNLESIMRENKYYLLLYPRLHWRYKYFMLKMR